MSRGQMPLGVVFIYLFVSNCVFAQVPNLMNYRGHAEGLPPGNTTQQVLFQLYTQDVGGTAIWSGTQSVDFFDGNFSVLLPLTPDLFTGGDRYFGITVGGETELSPRQQIASVPFALQASVAADAENATQALDADTLGGGAVMVDGSSRVGIGTTTPTQQLTVDGNVEVSGYGALLGGVHVGGTSDPGLDNLIVDGKIGMSNTPPEARLHVHRKQVGGSSAEDMLLVTTYTMFDPWNEYTNTNMIVRSLGSQGTRVGIETGNPQGTLDVNGTIYQRGAILHSDYVYDDEYELESIEEHARRTWEKRHLPAVPPRQTDENGLEIVEIGDHQRGMLEELEKAHIYIEQLNDRIRALEAKIEQLEQEPLQ